MDSKKLKVLTIVGVLILLVTVVGLTYAFFSPQAGGTTSTNAIVTSNTTDVLTFSINRDISFTVTQANFAENGQNQSGDATATATLTPNNKTGSATMNYYLYMLLDPNPITYSAANTNHDPELLLQVFDGSNQLVTLTELGNQKTIQGLTGYDITEKTGLLELLSNHSISASNNTATIENWRVVITLINLDVNQNDNTGKEITGKLIIRKNATTYCAENLNGTSCRISLDYNPATSNIIQFYLGMIYHHDNSLTNSAKDGSYRYAGNNPNNYLCFGSDAAVCPAGNIYRIIGLMPVDVVTDATTTPVTTERQFLYKIIKNDYVTSTEIGINSNGSADKINSYNGPFGNQPSGTIEGFYLSDSLINQGLNDNFITYLGSDWSNMIANVIWNVTEQEWDDVGSATPMSTVYLNEIENIGQSIENIKKIPNKIGLLYLNEYGYAAQSNNWTRELKLYINAINSNWLYRGVTEWIITERASLNYRYYLYNSGNISSYYESMRANGIRPTFYLTEDTIIDITNHAGTLADPYRISL